MTFAIETLDKVHHGWGRYFIATVRLPDGQTIRREIEDHGNAAAVLPYDPVRKTAIMVRLFRAPPFLAARRHEMLEVIAGMVESPDPIGCAVREAHEEAGLKLTRLEHVVSAWSMPGVSTERIHLYLAAYGESDRVGRGGGLAHEHENITAVEIPLGELATLADHGELDDIKSLVLVQALRLRRPDLFDVDALVRRI